VATTTELELERPRPKRAEVRAAWRRLDDWLPGASTALPELLGRNLDVEVVELVWPRWLTPRPASARRGEAVFDWQEVDRFLRFTRQLRHIKGRRHAGKPLELDLWQVAFVAAPVFGWRRHDGTRVVRELYLEVARKNGKSTLAAAILLYLLTADREPGAEVYSLAKDKDQARAVFGVAAAMVRASPLLRRKLRVAERSGYIKFELTNSEYRVLSSDKGGKAKHGLNVHGAVIDELHVITDHELVGTMDTATGSRSSPLLVFITTAGMPDESPLWHERREEVQAVAERVTEREELLGAIFAADPDLLENAPDSWRDPAVWLEANPSLGSAIEVDYLERQVAKVEAVPGRLYRFLRLHLNVPTESVQTSRISLVAWDATAGLVDEEDLAGARCYGGLDLASSFDLAALVLVFPDEANDRLDVLARFWTPGGTLIERGLRDKADYLAWQRAGFLCTNPGATIDYDAIEAELVTVLDRFEVKGVNYDPWGSKQLRSHLEDAGAPIWECRQGFATLSPPSKELERLVAEGKLRHGGNPVLRYCMSGLAFVEDPAGNIKPDRRRSTGRVDGMVALIMALEAWLTDETPGRSVYEDRGLEVAR
jgi:phage terminase large subunit-like protein